MTPDDPKPAKPSLRERFNNAVKSLRALTFRDLSGTAADTLRDLRQPKEIGILIVAIIVPGGMFAWGAHRVHKFRKKTASNDNTPQPKPDAPDRKPAQGKKPPKPTDTRPGGMSPK